MYCLLEGYIKQSNYSVSNSLIQSSLDPSIFILRVTSDFKSHPVFNFFLNWWHFLFFFDLLFLFFDFLLFFFVDLLDFVAFQFSLLFFLLHFSIKLFLVFLTVKNVFLLDFVLHNKDLFDFLVILSLDLSNTLF